MALYLPATQAVQEAPSTRFVYPALHWQTLVLAVALHSELTTVEVELQAVHGMQATFPASWQHERQLSDTRGRLAHKKQTREER